MYDWNLGYLMFKIEPDFFSLNMDPAAGLI